MQKFTGSLGINPQPEERTVDFHRNLEPSTHRIQIDYVHQGARRVIQHLSGCPGSGKTARVFKRIDKLRIEFGPSALIVVITCSRATADRLTGLLAGKATVLLNAQLPAYVHTSSEVPAHLVLHDSHRLSAGALRNALIQIRPSSVLSVGAAPFPHVAIANELGWRVQERLITHSFRAPVPHLPLVNALLKAERASNVLVHSARAEARAGRPEVFVAGNNSQLRRAVTDRIRARIACGTSPGSVGVICSSGAAARSFRTMLLSAGVPALAQADERFLRDLTRVLWISHGVLDRSPDSDVFANPAHGAKMAVALGQVQWQRLKDDCLKLRRRQTEFDAVFKECTRLYLRAKGGANARRNQDLRAFFGSWEPLCLDDAFTPSRLRDVIRNIVRSKPVICLTPQSCRGFEWEDVVIFGLEEGVWKRRAARHDEGRREAVEMMLVACTRASVSLSIFVSEPEVPLAFIERLVGKLPKNILHTRRLEGPHGSC